MKINPASDSKIGFFIIIVLTITLNSCENNKNDVIPDVYVNFTINLNDPQFVDLNGIGGAVTVNASTNNWGYTAAGYDGNGIIVYSGPDIFYAYDRTCPHDYAVNGLSVKVNIDFTLAVCPKCSTRYALSAGGTPASGIGRYPLKNYKTSFDGKYITVWNN
jgi:nitrite reductase/ring-hydroxylating ferredoxin subunit